MKNELLCGVATFVDCIYGRKLNLMLLAISLCVSLSSLRLTTLNDEPGERKNKNSEELNLCFKFACFYFSSLLCTPCTLRLYRVLSTFLRCRGRRGEAGV